MALMLRRHHVRLYMLHPGARTVRIEHYIGPHVDYVDAFKAAISKHPDSKIQSSCYSSKALYEE